MTHFIFLGLKRNYLTVVGYVGKDARGKKIWKCSCVCGNTCEIESYRLMNGLNRTCGCCQWHIKKKESYTSWMAMKQRCNDPARKDYLDYGGRGINYDPRWEDFIEFYLDMGSPGCDAITGERLSLERKENNLGYSKDNCKWATRSEQQLNKR